MKTLLVAVTWAALCFNGVAKEINNGETTEVKANSIWFQDADKLGVWQQKKGSHAKSLAAYEEKVLSAREAWQFTNPLTAKILKYDAAKRQVYVEMTTAGRMQGTKWWLDLDALAP
jgi:hypothetical protein